MCKTCMCVCVCLCAYGCQCLSVVQHKGNSVWCVSRQTHMYTYTNSCRHTHRSDRLYTYWIVVCMYVSESLHLKYNVCVCIYLCMYACEWMFLFCSALNCTRIGIHHSQRLLCESGTKISFFLFCFFQKISTLEKKLCLQVLFSIIIIAVEALATVFRFHSILMHFFQFIEQNFF